MWLRTPDSRREEQGLTGTTVAGYRLMRELGHGNTGTVFEACHERIGRRTAVKVLSGPLGRDPDLGPRALVEARAISLVEHPGIVAIVDCIQVDGVGPAIVMELLRGELLSDRMRRLRPLPFSRATRIAQRIAAALHAAHEQGIAHLHLGPANVMIVPDPEAMDGERVKVMDLGLAHMLLGADGAGAECETGRNTGTAILLGSPRYLAPEQCKGGCPVDGQADVYALGVLLYEMLAGRPLFDAPSRGELLALQILGTAPPLDQQATGLPPSLVGLVHRMLAKAPAERPTMLEVERLLQGPAEDGPLPPAALAPSHAQADEWDVQTDVSFGPGPDPDALPALLPDTSTAEAPTLVERATGTDVPPAVDFWLGRRQKQREVPLLLVSALVVLAFFGIGYSWMSVKERGRSPQPAAAVR